MYKGIGASAGIGIGKVVVIKEQSLDYKKETITDAEAEKKRLSEAIEVFIDKTAKMVEAMKVPSRKHVISLHRFLPWLKMN